MLGIIPLRWIPTIRKIAELREPLLPTGSKNMSIGISRGNADPSLAPISPKSTAQISQTELAPKTTPNTESWAMSIRKSEPQKTTSTFF